ncbi:PREDICTED: guanine nucleotide exchange factor DBS-like, partial [Propithecus coquereli]|uniref:guanine nucleotide exchange factor DBS-like n=1 Tax=Propithecus coquereli TaxID=379532 RepID=UPI00063F8914
MAEKGASRGTLRRLWSLPRRRRGTTGCSKPDEIMHQDIVPLCAADIQDQLRKRFAYLSGGRGQDGSPVITFPDYPAFSEIPDEEFQSVMTYLTSIPRGFCVVESPGTAGGAAVSVGRHHCRGPQDCGAGWSSVRLLAQLSETEAAFDEFWAKHQQKLEQCLQLRHFEQGFRE